MSKREWKPGDVAMVTLHSKASHVAMRDGVGSWASGTTFDRYISDREVAEARPLVVIDPEDREQAERLLAAYYNQTQTQKHDSLEDAFQAALREFANPTPPKPDEPLNLGAVVEDVDGGLWVRVKPCSRNYRKANGVDVGRYLTYADINAVRILSEGVAQ